MTKRTVEEAAGPRTTANETGITRRDVVTGGAVGLGAAALLGPQSAEAQTSTRSREIRWDHECDVLVVGAGCAGLTAAIRARDLGADVLVVEAALRRRRPNAAQRLVRVARRRRSRAAARHARRARRRGAHRGRRHRGPGRARRQRRAAVHRPHRLVDRRSPRLQPVPLQRARARARLGRELPGHPAVPDGQLRALRADQRHALRRRHVARPRLPCASSRSATRPT